LREYIAIKKFIMNNSITRLNPNFEYQEASIPRKKKPKIDVANLDLDKTVSKASKWEVKA
jgi:hypothetical protein